MSDLRYRRSSGWGGTARITPCGGRWTDRLPGRAGQVPLWSNQQQRGHVSLLALPGIVHQHAVHSQASSGACPTGPEPAIGMPWPAARVNGVARARGHTLGGDADAGHRRDPAPAEGPSLAGRVLHGRRCRDRAGPEVGWQSRRGRARRREQRMVERQLLASTRTDAGLRAQRTAPEHHGTPGPLLRRGHVRRLGAGQPGSAGLADELAAPHRRRQGGGAHAPVRGKSNPSLPPPVEPAGTGT